MTAVMAIYRSFFQRRFWILINLFCLDLYSATNGEPMHFWLARERLIFQYLSKLIFRSNLKPFSHPLQRRDSSTFFFLFYETSMRNLQDPDWKSNIRLIRFSCERTHALIYRLFKNVITMHGYTELFDARYLMFAFHNIVILLKI